jgi:predicted DsbA family dithiol-disulfide isomerase
MPPLTVDLFSDVVCPWCFVGSERLERVLATLPAEEGPVEVVHHPFLLDPDTPEEGKDIPAMLRRKYGVEPEQLWARLEAQALEAGIVLDLAKQPRSYPTVRAHTLLRHAQAKGTQRALARSLFGANFLEARNVSDPAVLAEVASGHGFGPDETARLIADPDELEATRREAAAAAEGGIQGVPFFIFNRRLAVSGAQPEAVLRDVIARARASGS